jgi:hypothetical protein
LYLVLITERSTKHLVLSTKSHRFSGDFVDRVTPVPIPNTEVKPVGADGTARETAWESRKSPGLIQKSPLVNSSGLFYLTPTLPPPLISLCEAKQLIDEAKDRFFDLITAASKRNEVIIADKGKALARIVPPTDASSYYSLPPRP